MFSGSSLSAACGSFNSSQQTPLGFFDRSKLRQSLPHNGRFGNDLRLKPRARHFLRAQVWPDEPYSHYPLLPAQYLDNLNHLCLAALMGDKVKLADRLIQGADPNIDGSTDSDLDFRHTAYPYPQALHCAAYGGHEECIRILLLKKANILGRDEYGRIPLFYAAANGKFAATLRLIKTEPKILNAADYNGLRLLHFAALGGNTKLYTWIQNTQNLKSESIDSFFRTPLHYAAMKGDALMMGTILKILGPNPNIYDLFGCSLVHYVVLSGNLDAIYKTINFFKSYLCITKHGAPYILRGEWGKLVTLKERQSLLHYAVLSGEIDAIWAVAALPTMDVNLQDNVGWTALHLAVSTRASLDVLKALKNIPWIHKDIKNYQGLTPSDLAYKLEYLSAAELLK